MSVENVWGSRQLLIAQRLRARRDVLGLTQKQVVSRLARYGIKTTNRAVSGLERGAGIDVAKLPELAIALDCTVTFLVGLTEDPHQWEPDAAGRPRRHVPDAASVNSPAQRPADGRVPVHAGRPALIIAADVPSRGFRRG